MTSSFATQPALDHRLTVGIVHLNSGPQLARLIASLELAVHPRLDLNLLVIDHGSKDESAGAVTDLARDWPGAQVLLDERNNLGRSRQSVLQKASTNWVAFLDADIEMDKAWAGCVVASLDRWSRDPRVAGFTAVTELRFDDHRLRFIERWRESFWFHALSAQLRPGAKKPRLTTHLPGGTAFYRRSTVLDVGGFSDRFSSCGEDLELGFRLRGAGLKLYEDPEVRVVHRSRRTPRQWLKRCWRFGVTRGWLVRKWPRPALEPHVIFGFSLPAAEILTFLLFGGQIGGFVLLAQFFFFATRSGGSINSGGLVMATQHVYGFGLWKGLIFGDAQQR